MASSFRLFVFSMCEKPTRVTAVLGELKGGTGSDVEKGETENVF